MSLDKGLDNILSSVGISSGGPGNRQRNRNAKKSTSGGKVGKASTRNSKPAKNASQPKNKVNAALSTNPLVTARRAVVSNMPLDVSEKDVKNFFADRIGRVRKIEGTYRENGKPTGTFTLTFEKDGNALKLLETYNNEPIDGGKSRLVVQILLDAATAASKVAKPLSERIGQKSSGRKDDRRQSRKNDAKPKKAVAAKAPVAAKKSTKSKSKPRPKAKSAADLDAEMTDYFARADDIAV